MQLLCVQSLQSKTQSWVCQMRVFLKGGINGTSWRSLVFKTHCSPMQGKLGFNTWLKFPNISHAEHVGQNKQRMEELVNTEYIFTPKAIALYFIEMNIGGNEPRVHGKWAKCYRQRCKTQKYVERKVVLNYLGHGNQKEALQNGEGHQLTVGQSGLSLDFHFLSYERRQTLFED